MCIYEGRSDTKRFTIARDSIIAAKQNGRIKGNKKETAQHAGH